MNNPILTILSDLGTRDAAVANTKAIIMRHVPQVSIVDISHKTDQHDLQQAAYLLLSAYKHFAKGTIHLLMVEVFAGDNPRVLLAEKDGHYFIAPDNGILPLAFGTMLVNTRLCFECGRPFVFNDWVNKAAAVIALLQSGQANTLQPVEITTAPQVMQPKPAADGVECNILHVDRYENVVLNITKPMFDAYLKNRPFRITVVRMDDITALSSNYNDVPRGAPLCRFNNAGFLEIAINHDKAATLLGLDAYHTGNLRYKTIKIWVDKPGVMA